MAAKLITLPLRVWLGSARLLTRTAGAAAGRAVSLAGHAIGVGSSNGSDHGGRSAPATADPGWREESIEEPVSPVDVEHPDEEPAAPEAPTQAPQARESGRARRAPAERARKRSTPAARTRTRPAPTDGTRTRPTPAVPEPARPAPAARPLNTEPQTEPAPETAPVREPVPDTAPVQEPAPDTAPLREPAHVSEEPELVREVAEPGAEDGAGAHITVAPPWDGYAQMNARQVIARTEQASPAELAAVRLYESRHRSRQTVLAAVDRQLKLSGGGNPA